MAERIALDIHTHLVPTGPDLTAFEGVAWQAEQERLVIDGHVVGLKSLFRPADLLAWMDRHRVARAWVSAPPPSYRPGLPVQEAARWIAFLNDGLATIVAGAPDRLSMLRHLPVEHPALAASVAATASTPGMAGFAMASGPAAGAGLSDPSYRPLWQALDAAGAFLLIHPGESDDPRLAPFYLGNLVGNPVETGIAAAHLVLGGVLARHPRLRVCLAHAGGITPGIAGRLQRGFDTARPGLDPALPPPREQMRRVWIDCMAHDPAGYALAVATHGEAHVLFGSDWPFPMGLPDPHGLLASLPDAARLALFGRDVSRVTA